METAWVSIHQPSLRMFFDLILQIFLCLEAFECNTTSDWLNHTVEPIRSCVTPQFANLGGKRQRMFLKIVNADQEKQMPIMLRFQGCCFCKNISHKSEHCRFTTRLHILCTFSAVMIVNQGCWQNTVCS